MRTLSTAIIHLRDPCRSTAPCVVKPLVELVRGVAEVRFIPSEGVITIEYDSDQTGLADLVRLIEDAGSVVAGVALRRVRRPVQPRLSRQRRLS